VAPVDRLGERLRQARRTSERLLVVYLTVADPLTSGPPELALVLARSGADVLELGLPTPSTRPAGVEIAESFRRAGTIRYEDIWRRISELRRALPDTPLLALCYPETVTDIGWSDLLGESAQAGIDGIVLTAPTDQDMGRVLSAGLHAIPLIRPTIDRAAARALEKRASSLSYRPLAARTGEPLDLISAVRAASALQNTATKPFLLGFGIRNSSEIAALAPYAAGVVVGSELLRLIQGTASGDRAARAAEATRAWKAALRPTAGEAPLNRPADG
jgi:tryptophan synthase alpha chain